MGANMAGHPSEPIPQSPHVYVYGLYGAFVLRYMYSGICYAYFGQYIY